jgi:hypothetical protein
MLTGALSVPAIVQFVNLWMLIQNSPRLSDEPDEFRWQNTYRHLLCKLCLQHLLPGSNASRLCQSSLEELGTTERKDFRLDCTAKKKELASVKHMQVGAGRE